MAVTVEDAGEVIRSGDNSEVGIHDGVSGRICLQRVQELAPVVIVSQYHEGFAVDVYGFGLTILCCGIAVLECQGEVTSACPRFATCDAGTDVVGRKKTVVDGCRALVLAIADESAVIAAFFTLEAAVELTVTYDDRSVVAQAGNQAAIICLTLVGAAVAETLKGTVDGDRRAAVLDGDRRASLHLSDDTGYVPFVG